MYTAPALLVMLVNMYTAAMLGNMQAAGMQTIILPIGAGSSLLHSTTVVIVTTYRTTAAHFTS